MASQIRLGPSQLRDMQAILEMGVADLERVILELDSLESLPLSPVELHEKVASALEGDDGKVNALLRPIFGLNQLIRQREMTIDGVLEGIREGIELADPPWESDAKNSWEQSIEPLLRRLFESPAIRTVSKALDLAYDHANLYQGARIVTDIRPIFNDDDDDVQIDGAVIAFVLRLNYDSRDGNHSLSIALDEVDVLSLAKQCERAMKKAARAKQTMIQKAEINTIVSGGADESTHSV